MNLFRSVIAATTLFCAATVVHGQVLAIATNPQGTLYYSVGAAIAAVMQQKAGLTVRVQATSGTSAYVPLLNRGEVEFGPMNAIDVVNAFNGVVNFKDRKNPELRLVGVLFPLPVAMAVPNDSPAKSIKDLKGMRMPSQFTAQTTVQFIQDALLATGGLSIADMKPFPVTNYIKGMQALGEGKVDSAMFGVGTGASQEVHIARASRGGLRYLSVTDAPEALAAMRKVFAGAYVKVVEPSPGYTGILAPTRIMLYSVFLVTSPHGSADVVYKATKAIYENKPMLEAASATMKTFDPGVMVEANTVPYHPGAERFFKEVGAWPPKAR